MNHEEDLNELDRIWPLGKLLIVPDGGKVMVAGAYEGRYIDYVCTRFKPGKVIGFEPQMNKALAAEDRVHRHGDIVKIYGTGIGVQDCEAFFDQVGTDGCKVCRAGPDATRAKLRSIDGVLDDHGPFDLFICNMEGYEIPLLAYLCATERMAEIKSLAIQFHGKESKLVGAYGFLADYYGIPIYNDLPTWGYFRA